MTEGVGGRLLCLRCSEVKETQRRAFCTACENDIEKARLRDRYVDQYKSQSAEIRARNRAYKYRTKGLVASRPCPDKCELCDRHTRDLTRALALDHCHVTGRFRGWLCGNCNTGLGKLGDDAEGLYRALEYLSRANTNTEKQA